MSPDLDAIRARLAAATPGEWRVIEGAEDHDGYPYRFVAFGVVESDNFVNWGADSTGMDDFDPGHPNSEGQANAELIANAPADLAALLAAVDDVLSRHQPIEDGGIRNGECADCGQVYPCPDARACGVTG